MSLPTQYPIGTNWVNGKDRISYHPEWDAMRPFITYRNGTAGVHRGTLNAAMLYLGHGRTNAKDWVQS